MWEEQKRSRFQSLRQREHDNQLTRAEDAELQQLIRELEASEAAYLIPATERLRQKREAIENQNLVLEGLARRKEALAERLRAVLAEADAERQMIDSELTAVLAGSSGQGREE
jgi:hypothetical protein